MGTKTKDALQQMASLATILASFGLTGKDLVAAGIAALTAAGMLGAYNLGTWKQSQQPAPTVIESQSPPRPVAATTPVIVDRTVVAVPGTPVEVRPPVGPTTSPAVESRDTGRDMKIATFCAGHVMKENARLGDPVRAQLSVAQKLIDDCRKEMTAYHATDSFR